MARDPNGTGNFTAMTPTFEASNSPEDSYDSGDTTDSDDSDDSGDTSDSDDADDSDENGDTNDENKKHHPNRSGHSHTGTHGNIHGNSTVEFTDALLLLKILCGITPPSSTYGALDIDGDGYFGESDILYILNALQQQVQNSPSAPQQTYVQAVPLQQEQISKYSPYQGNTGVKQRR